MAVSTNYRQDIQVLRGIAVIAVLLFHTLGETFPLGYLGVDVFFVISGFVIAPLMLRILQEDGDLEDRIRRLRQFLKSRFSRLAPALVVTLIIFTFIMFLLGPVQDHQRVARQGVASLFLMGNFGAYKYQGDYFTPAANPLVHTWSLSVEAQIYILLPLLLIVFFQKKSLRTKNVYVFFSAVSIISFGSFLITLKSSEIFSARGVEGTTQFSFYWTMNRVWQFSIGTLAYLLVSHSKIRMIRGRKILNVLLGIFLVTILFSRLSISLSSGSVLASFIALAILVNRSLEVLPKIVLYTFEWIGNRSYSIYLVHMPVLYIVNLWPLEDLSNQIPELIRSILVIGGSVFLGRVLFEKIEKRFRYESILNLQGIKNSFYVFVAILLMPILLLLGLDQSSALLTFERGMPPKPKILPWDWDEECKFYSTSLRVIDEPCTYSHLGSDKSIMLIGLMPHRSLRW